MTIKVTEVFPPKICFTVSGCLIVDQKILLVKHRKAGFWLKPGGHVEPNELPHQAAVREFEEETGISVELVRNGFLPDFHNLECEFVPLPFAANVHWVSHQNYEQRLKSAHPQQLITNGLWDRGCEQHYHLDYLLQPSTASLQYQMDAQESLDIGWFSLEQIANLETTPDIRLEIEYAFKLLHK